MPLKKRKPEQLAAYNLSRRVKTAMTKRADWARMSRRDQLDALYDIRELLRAAEETRVVCMVPGVHYATQKTVAKYIAAAYGIAREYAQEMPRNGEFFWVSYDIQNMLEKYTDKEE